eukprot:jgi/Phyca11/113688/e_gw1.24.557.1
MSVPFIKSLQELVASGDYGDKKYPLLKIQVKIERSKDRCIFGTFCWKKILESDAPALLFTAACNIVAGSGDYDPAKFQEAKDNFLANLVMPEKSEKARIGARAKHDTRRRKMEAVRGAKKGRRED